MQKKKSCPGKNKYLHPNHSLTLAALASELVKSSRDTREIKNRNQPHLPRSKSFPGLNSSPHSNGSESTCYCPLNISDNQEHSISDHCFPLTASGTTEYKYIQLILQECYSATSATVFLCFFLPPFPQFYMLWDSFASPNKKQNFNYLSSGRLWPCSSLHRTLQIWHLALWTDSLTGSFTVSENKGGCSGKQHRMSSTNTRTK